MVNTTIELMTCTKCKKKRTCHTIGIFYGQTRMISRKFHILLMCGTCKTIIPVAVKEPKHKGIPFGSGPIYCCYQRLFKVYKRGKDKIGLKCKKCQKTKVLFNKEVKN